MESTMTDVVATDPHLFGISKVDDVDTLRQMLGGWLPGIDTQMPSRRLALVDVHGEAYVVTPGETALDVLAYPVRVLVAATLPAQQVKDPDAARPYQR